MIQVNISLIKTEYRTLSNIINHILPGNVHLDIAKKNKCEGPGNTTITDHRPVHGTTRKKHQNKDQDTCTKFKDMGGRRSSPSPLEKSQNYRVFTNTGSDPLYNKRLPSQHSMLGHHRPASETPFIWCSAGGTMVVRF